MSVVTCARAHIGCCCCPERRSKGPPVSVAHTRVGFFFDAYVYFHAPPCCERTRVFSKAPTLCQVTLARQSGCSADSSPRADADLRRKRLFFPEAILQSPERPPSSSSSRTAHSFFRRANDPPYPFKKETWRGRVAESGRESAAAAVTGRDSASVARRVLEAQNAHGCLRPKSKRDLCLENFQANIIRIKRLLLVQ